MSLALTQLAGFGGKAAAGGLTVELGGGDGVSTDNTTGSYTFSNVYIGAASTGRRVLVPFAASDNGTSNSVVSATIGGIAASIVTQVSPTNATNAGFLIAQVDTGTNADIVVTGAANCWQNMTVRAIILRGLSSNTATDTAQVPNTTTTTPNAAIDCNAGGYIFGVVAWRDLGVQTDTTWSSLTPRDGYYIDSQLTFSVAFTLFATAQTSLTITATGSQAPAQSSLALCSFSA